MAPPQASVRRRLRQILATREYNTNVEDGSNGALSPERYLRYLLRDLRASSRAIPDAGAWKVKFTSGSGLLTLFHKESDQHGPSIRDIVRAWGYVGQNGHQNFRYTVCGQSENFAVSAEDGLLRVHRRDDDSIVAQWSHDALLNDFARKLRNLVHVQGSWNNRTRVVAYKSAAFLSQARTTKLISLIVDGTICIDFDAYIRDTGAVRNYGTKFRIRPGDLSTLYAAQEPVE